MAVPSPPPPPPLLPGDSITPSQSGSSLISMTGTEASVESSKEDKPWKRPSTLDEVRQSAKSWSLAGDAGLLLYFKQFSQNMLLRTHELEKVVDDLVHDTKGMGSKVHNTFNDFLMLSNKQFIENRVYDEEVSQDETAEKEPGQQPAKTREQLESEILPRFSEAVNLGFQVLDDAFITVEINAADESDEDEEGLPSGYVPDPIIEPKDMYASRPLPHLIGSAEFFSDETLGLIEVDDEEEETKKDSKKEEEEETSESETESESESEYSESSEEDLPKKSSKKEVSDQSESEEESDSDEDLFGEKKKKPISSSEDSQSENEEVKKPKPKMDMQAELAAKLGIKEQQPTTNMAAKVVDDDDADTRSVTSKSTLDNQSLMNAGDTVSITSASKAKKEKKHRSRTKSSDGHKHHHTHKKATDTGQLAPSKVQDRESDEDLFEESKQKNSYEDEGLFGKKGGLFSGGGTLFDDQGGDDLFSGADDASKPTIAEEKVEEPKSPSEIKPRTRTTTSGKKIPVGAVSLFGESTPLFGGSPGSAKESTVKEEDSATKSDHAKKPPPLVKGLFDDDDEMFAEKPKQDLLQEPPKQRRKKTLELFDDDEESLFAAKPSISQEKAAKPSKKIEPAKSEKTAGFESDSQGLFGAGPTPQGKQEPAAIKKSNSKPKVVSLFDDDGGEEEDWFDNINPVKATNSAAPKNSVSPKEDDDALFNEPKQSTSIAASKKKEEGKKPSKSKKVVSLFDEDEDDLFGAGPSEKPPEIIVEKTTEKQKKVEEVKSSNEKPKVKKHPKTKSFIDDTANGLFGDEQEDLFNTPNKVTSKKEESKVEKKPTPKAAISFLDDDDDDDEEDGFFSVPKKEKKPPTKSKAATTEPKKITSKVDTPVSDSPISFNDDDGLFATEEKNKNGKEKSSKHEVEEASEVEKKSEISEEEDQIVQKPKKLPGAVSLFGGIDPFAAKKNLKSPSKEKAKPLPVADVVEEGENDLFGKEPAQEKPTTFQAKKPVVKKPDIVKKEPVEKPSAIHKEEPMETKQAETPKKIKPSISFNPATMLPGATPPLRNTEASASSFDQPATVNSLHHANKDRARIQKKRRPPSRHFVQSTATTTTTDSFNEIPAAVQPVQISTEDIFSKPDTDRLNSKATTSDNTFTKPVEKKEVQKPIGHADIFFDDEDDLFSPKSFTPTNKGKDRAKHDVTESKDRKPQRTNEQLTDEFEEKVAPPKSEVAPTKSEVTSTKSEVTPTKSEVTPPINQTKTDAKAEQGIGIFGETKTSNDIFDSEPNAKITPKKTQIDKTKKPQVKEETNKFIDDIFNIDSAKDETDKSLVDGDIFSTQGGSDAKAKNIGKNTEKLLDDNEELFESSKSVKQEKETTKPKKNKEGANIFKNDVPDGIFSADKPKKDDKKEAAKKAKKSSRIVTDDDLFGDTGSIFGDLPTKGKEKKKKKSSAGKDIFASKDEDIFATGGDKKAKTKKKTEKTTKTKTTKTVVPDKDAPNIFDDPLSAAGGD